MVPHLGNLAATLPARCPGNHVLVRDPDVVALDCVCALHARSPTAERQNRRTAIAVMLRGSFYVRASEGATLASAGMLLFKNAGSHHAYRHLDDHGDRSITFELDDGFLETVRASLGLRRRGAAFAHLAIPASPRTAAAVVLTEQAVASGEPDALREAALSIIEVAFSEQGPPARDASPAHVRRVTRVLRHVDAHPEGDCSLATLAELAGLSRFHFARTFRALVGQTPRQYVIAARLRAAATALASTTKPVTEVAMDAGFADLSNFTTTFRRAFGVSPGRYRR